MRKLEAELGVDLVTRTTPVRLTAAGEQVAKRARTVINEIDAIRADTARADESVTGQLTIGTMHWLGHLDVPAVLATFSERHPNVRVTLVERTTPEMLGAVRAGDLDVTFLSLLDTDDRPRGIRIADLGTEPLVIAGQPGSLPDTHVHLRFLHDKPFVAFAEGMNLRATVDAALRREGVRPHTILASNEPLTVRDLVAQGLGHALLPAGLANAPGAALDTAHVHAPGVQRRLGLAWRADRRPSAPAHAFIITIREAPARRAPAPATRTPE